MPASPPADRTRIALVTGAASGIGLATATGLAKQGFHVVLLTRNAARGAAAIAAVQRTIPTKDLEVLECDLSRQSSVRAAAATFHRRHDRLDVLVNCAGVFLPEKAMTEDGVEMTFATNYLGHFLLTDLLLPALRRSGSGRIVTIASRYGGAKIDFSDLNFEKRPFSYLKAVPASKLAEVLWTQELAAQLKDSGITVNAVHPGLVARTKLLEQTRGFFRWLTNRLGGTPEKGADTGLWLATSPEAAGKTGLLWAKRKPMKTPGQGSDAAARRQLWEASERLIKPVAAKPAGAVPGPKPAVVRKAA